MARAITAVMVALALAALPASVDAHDVKTGVAAWQKGDYDAAVAAWRPLAAKGDADAAFNLGQAYRFGKGVPLSPGLAQKWYEVAARKGHVDAATSLGSLLFQNSNRTSAMRWLHQAADSGEPRAELIYGTALYNGEGVKPDPVLAYSYVSRAAAQGYAPARATLADMDSIMPLDQRQRGVALARAAIGAKPGKAKAATLPAPVAIAKSTPTKPITKPARMAIKVPSPAAASSGGWRVQLGAFSKRASAETLFRFLSGGALAGRQAYYIPVSAVTRLQAGPFSSKAEAAAACARLKGQPCFPVNVK